MMIVGISYTMGADGQRRSTLHVTDNFDDYYSNSEAGRGCLGKKTDAIYVGNYDCSALKIGMEIDIAYDKAVTTAKGAVYQSVKRIDILNSKKAAAPLTQHTDATNT